ncbi:hypothetical protein [Xanthomonas fragariae]|uniref:hypothetical protein n=1 Tax=Xanthomonas fragariae TaxID=48664 RepID=UPI00131F2571|nr:hypothetical protein [Xanthomonas fragariae]
MHAAFLLLRASGQDGAQRNETVKPERGCNDEPAPVASQSRRAEQMKRRSPPEVSGFPGKCSALAFLQSLAVPATPAVSYTRPCDNAGSFGGLQHHSADANVHNFSRKRPAAVRQTLRECAHCARESLLFVRVSRCW